MGMIWELNRGLPRNGCGCNNGNKSKPGFGFRFHLRLYGC